MVELVGIHDAGPESRNFDILDLVEIATVDWRLVLGRVACHELPNLSWDMCNNAGYDAILGILESVRRTLLAVWVGPNPQRLGSTGLEGGFG